MEHTSKNIHRNELFMKLLAICAVVVLAGFTTSLHHTLPRSSDTEEQQAAVHTALEEDPFAHVHINGRAVYVFDAQTEEVLFERNASAQLPLASITKSMIALIAYEHLDASHTVPIHASALVQEGDSGFVTGETWRLRDIVDFTMMTSSNDGASAIAEEIERVTNQPIADLMNKKAREIGLLQTYFLNETGLDEHEQLFSGAYGSARDTARLFAYTLQHAPLAFEATAFTETKFANIDGTEYQATNTNKSIGNIPGLLAGKTGFTDLAGGNLAVAFDIEPGHTIIVVVLGSTLEERFTDVEKLVRATLQTTH